MNLIQAINSEGEPVALFASTVNSDTTSAMDTLKLAFENGRDDEYILDTVEAKMAEIDYTRVYVTECDIGDC